MTIRKGCIARCSLGLLGLVTSNKPELVTYPDGNKGMAWTGIHITNVVGLLGEPWSSRDPKLVAAASTIENWGKASFAIHV